MLLLATLSACGGMADDVNSEGLRGERAERLRREKFVLDSLSRFVDTDSLYRIREAMRLPGDTLALLNASLCEVVRLQWRYGVIPAELAMKRMQDTLWRGARSEERRRLELYPGRAVNIAVTRACEEGPKSPEKVAGVSLDLEPNGKSIAPPRASDSLEQ